MTSLPKLPSFSVQVPIFAAIRWVRHTLGYLPDYSPEQEITHLELQSSEVPAPDANNSATS